MNNKELKKTVSFLNGRSKTASIRPAFTILCITPQQWTGGGYVIIITYSLKTDRGEEQLQTLIPSFKQAVARFGAYKFYPG
jgi:hypothetical protein